MEGKFGSTMCGIEGNRIMWRKEVEKTQKKQEDIYVGSSLEKNVMKK